MVRVLDAGTKALWGRFGGRQTADVHNPMRALCPMFNQRQFQRTNNSAITHSPACRHQHHRHDRRRRRPLKS